MIYLVDSSGWIEYFGEGPRSAEYSKYLKDQSRLITPTIVLYEVYKRFKKERTEGDALIVVSSINKTKIVPLTESIALFAGDLSLRHGLHMADAIVYATALEGGAKVITSDEHFRGLEGVVII